MMYLGKDVTGGYLSSLAVLPGRNVAL